MYTYIYNSSQCVFVYFPVYNTYMYIYNTILPGVFYDSGIRSDAVEYNICVYAYVQILCVYLKDLLLVVCRVIIPFISKFKWHYLQRLSVQYFPTLHQDRYYLYRSQLLISILRYYMDNIAIFANKITFWQEGMLKISFYKLKPTPTKRLLKSQLDDSCSYTNLSDCGQSPCHKWKSLCGSCSATVVPLG